MHFLLLQDQNATAAVLPMQLKGSDFDGFVAT